MRAVTGKIDFGHYNWGGKVLIWPILWSRSCSRTNVRFLRLLTSIKLKNILVRAVLVCHISCIAVAWKAWFPVDRVFPMIPLWDWLDVSPAVHLMLSGLMLLALLLFFWKPEKRLAWMLIALLIGACLLDQLRWQPYIYHFLILYLLFIFSKSERVFEEWVLVISMVIYFWSGLHKLHPFSSLLYARYFPGWPTFVGNLPGGLELLFGLGLAFRQTRIFSVVGLVMMHLVILSFIGPFGGNYNHVVWGWNLLMIFILVKKAGSKANWLDIFQENRKQVYMALAVFLLPIGSFFGVYPNYFSFKLYDYNTPMVIWELPEEGARLYPQECIKTSRQGQKYLALEDWTLNRLGIALYPEISYFKKISAKGITGLPKGECRIFDSKYEFYRDYYAYPNR